MKSLLKLVGSFLVLMVFAASGLAQTPSNVKEFSKDGLSFSYPSGWTFNDTSDADAQKMAFGRADSEAQISVFVFRTHVNTPERVAEAKKVLVDPYVASTNKSLEQMGAKPERAPAVSEIGGVKSEGVKIKASLDGVPGAAEIHWAVVGQRLVVLTFFGSDKALPKETPTWDAIRNSLKIEEPQTQPKPQATPTPAP